VERAAFIGTSHAFSALVPPSSPPPLELPELPLPEPELPLPEPELPLPEPELPLPEPELPLPEPPLPEPLLPEPLLPEPLLPEPLLPEPLPPSPRITGPLPLLELQATNATSRSGARDGRWVTRTSSRVEARVATDRSRA
jgi:hypothetical protein